MHRNKPAYPGTRIDQDTGLAKFEPGMTLRDYFATHALPLVAADFPNGHPEGWYGLAKVAYKVADAMAAARDHDA